MSADALRKRELGLIHMAKAHFRTTAGMTDDDYRAVVRQVTGASSSADLDAAGREKLLKHFKAKGFVVKPTGKPNQTRTLAQDAQSRKVRAMWLMLHAMGQVEDPSEVALQAYVRRMAKVDALQWADHYAVIEGLKSWALRHLPKYLKQGLIALDMDALTPGQREDLTNMVNSVNRAKAEGVEALFDYYWPIYRLLDGLTRK